MWNRNQRTIEGRAAVANAALCAGLLVLLLTAAVGAESPSRFQYEGRLFDDAGEPLAGPVDIQIGLWSAVTGGSLLYDETHVDEELSDGAFSIAVGEGTPSGAAFAADLFEDEVFMEVAVDTDTLTPRHALHPVPQALVAKQAETLQGGDTLLADVTALQAADTTLQTNIDAEGAARSGGDALLDTRVTAVEAGTLSAGINVNGFNSESTEGLLVTNQGALMMNMAGEPNYDVWIQGRKNGSIQGGDSRNLAMLGVVSTDELVLNWSGEYTGGTSIQSDLDVSGTATASGGFAAGSGEIPDDIWSLGATWVQGAEGSLGTAGGYGLSLMWNGYRQAAGSFGVCVEAGQPTGEVCYQAGAGSCSGGGDCVCTDDYGTPSSVGACGWTLGGVGSTQPFDVISYLNVDQNGIDFRSSDYGAGDYPRKNLSAPSTRMRITPAGNVGIGTTSPTEKLMVTGNLRVYGPTSGTPEGGVISAERGGSGAVVLDPTGSTSGYTATLSLDDTGFKVGHNSASRNIEFQTGDTTRMKIATNGDVDIEGDLTFGPSNTSLTTALASAGGSVGNLVSVGQSALANNTTGENNVAVGIQALQDNGAGGDNVALGAYGLANNTSGTGNVAVGTATLLQNQDGSYNTGVGDRSLYSNTTGSYNTANGRYALYSNTTGISNAAHGAEALYKNTTGSNNTASGREALYSNTTGSYNTASGRGALYSNTEGIRNTANGSYALQSNTTGSRNTASGFGALQYNTTGVQNTASGSGALDFNTTGSRNTASGASALYMNTMGSDNTASGYGALYTNTWGHDNTASGAGALYSNTAGDYNTASGVEALYSNTTGNSNTASGNQALYSNTTGKDNTASGAGALYSNTTGSRNTASGHGALDRNTEGSDNTASGNYALFSNTTGTANTASGGGALYLNTTGSRNTASGFGALDRNTEGSDNTASGNYALYSNTTGDHNTASGVEALYSNTEGTRNTASGNRALFSNTTGTDNTASGYEALISNTTGTANTASGGGALYLNTEGSDNTASGYGALFFNTTGTANTASGNGALFSNTTGTDNTASGAGALYFNTIGTGLVAVGRSALYNNTEGTENTASGHEALYSNTTGTGNTASGYQALYWNSFGPKNTAVGYNSLHNNHSGTGNTAVGYEALHDVLGSYNIGIGKSAGSYNTGSYNISIGSWGEAGDQGTIRIGAGTTGGTSYTHTRAFIGGIRGVTTGGAYAVPVLIDHSGQLGTVNSSARYKEDIESMANRSAALGALRPVTFRYKKAYADGSKPLQYGLVAEEVAEVFPELVVFDGEGRPETVKYHWLSSLLVNEFQKLSTRHEKVAEQVAEKDAALAQLQEQNEAMRTRLALLEALPERLAALEAQMNDRSQVARTGASGVEHFAMQQK